MKTKQGKKNKGRKKPIALSGSSVSSPSSLLFTTEKTMASLPVDFRLFQFRSSTFASGKKRGARVFRVDPATCVSFFIGSYHGTLFPLSLSLLPRLFAPTYLTLSIQPTCRPPSRFPAPLCVHFNKDREGFVGTQRVSDIATAPASMFLCSKRGTKMHVDSAQMRSHPLVDTASLFLSVSLTAIHAYFF